MERNPNTGRGSAEGEKSCLGEDTDPGLRRETSVRLDRRYSDGGVRVLYDMDLDGTWDAR